MEKNLSKLILVGLLFVLPCSASSMAMENSRDANMVTAKYFQISPRPLNPEKAKSLLAAFRFRQDVKPETSAVNIVWRDKLGNRLAYETAFSEFAFTNEMAAPLDPKESVPDSLIRRQADVLAKSILNEKFENCVFANWEKTMVQKRDPQRKDSVGPALPAYYAGRYLPKVDGRIVLGDALQIRVAYGAEGAMQAFSYRDPDLVEAGTLRIPSRQMVIDSLKKWEKSRTHSRTYTYPYHPDTLGIRSIKPVRIFDSYLVSKEKMSAQSRRDAEYLVPTVTVLAEVTLTKSRKKLRVPAPEGPILLHFHFPCRPAAGLCWPDGKQDLQDQAPAQP